MENAIETGQLLQVSASLTIDADYTVYSNGIPVGSITYNLCWFKKSPKPHYRNIEQIVYLGNYAWGLKQLTNPLTEFQSLSDELQYEILTDLMDDSDKYHNDPG